MTNLEIVNRALRSLGSLKASAMTDTTKNAARAITAYPLCRDEVLRMIPWPSCSHRELAKNMIDQACPWTASHAYLLGEQVTNDTNKIYKCTIAGISAAAGGPTGTGTGITDGTAIWAYVGPSTALTNWCHWPLTDYVVGDLVTWDIGKVYVCDTAGATGAATPPTGVIANQVDGTAKWDYYCTPPYNRTVYAYQYIIPYDFLRVFKVPNLAAVKESDQGVQYLLEGKCLYCDQLNSFIKYVKRDLNALSLSEDPSNWDSLLCEVVALKIASEIAFEVTGQKEIAILAFQKFSGAYASARMVALNEGAESTPEPVRWENV